MYTSCLEKEKETGESSKENTSFNSDFPEKSNLNNDKIFPNPGKKIPVKIILCENEEVNSTQNGTEPFENNSSGHLTPSPLPNLTENFIRFSSSNINNFSIDNPFVNGNNANQMLNLGNLNAPNAFVCNSESKYESLFNKKDKIVYIFNILKSRKKEKKYLRKKYNKIISRVHNMDCLLKKIKAKFLKYLFLNIKNDLKVLRIDVKKFDQCKEVRNLNVPHNRDNFINLTVVDVLINNNIIEYEECQKIFNSNNNRLKDYMTKKIKTLYQFDFLRSSYFRNWLNDPIKIFSENVQSNKNCEKFPNHSKNIFKNNIENYDRYKKLLLHTACNFLFYFQNNPLKFGKKQREILDYDN